MVNTSSPTTSSPQRKLPNIVITGTPGTGKTSHAQAFLEACPHKFQHLLIGDIVKEKECHEGWNEEWQSYDVDDEKVGDCFDTGGCLELYFVVAARRHQNAQLATCTMPLTSPSQQLLDVLEDEVQSGGKIIDWHSCETFPERWVDLVVVLRCDHTKLWERLEKR